MSSGLKTIFQRVPRFVFALLGLVLFGLVRSPVEDGLRERLVAANLLLPPPGQGAIEQMSQSALMGTLGGLRSLVATFLTLEAFEDAVLDRLFALNATRAAAEERQAPPSASPAKGRAKRPVPAHTAQRSLLPDDD